MADPTGNTSREIPLRPGTDDAKFRRARENDLDARPADLDMPPVGRPRPGSGGGTIPREDRVPSGGSSNDLFGPDTERKAKKIESEELKPVVPRGESEGRQYDSNPDSNGGAKTPGPLLPLDSKITWRSAPERTRVKVRTGLSAPVVARNVSPEKSVDPNSEWRPAGAATKIVRK